jgi:hypothetical protein
MESYSFTSAQYESEAIPVTGRGGLQGCEMLRIPQCLDNRFTHGGKAVSLTSWPRSIPYKHYFFTSGTHFCSRLRGPQGLVRPEGLGKWTISFASRSSLLLEIHLI